MAVKDELKRKLVILSRKYGREKAKIAKKNVGSNKRKLAEEIYRNTVKVNYGFEEALKTGNYGQFPHEVKESANCLTYAAMQYFIADAIELKPKMYWVHGLKNHPNNPKNNFGSYEHAIVDVDVGTKNRLLIDKTLGMFGYVIYDLFKKIIKVRDNDITENTIRTFDELEEISFDKLIDRIMYYRSAEGAVKILGQGQNIRKINVFYCFDEGSDTLEARFNCNSILSANEALIQKFHFDKFGRIDKSSLLMGLYSELGWLDYKDWAKLGEFDMEVVDKFSDSIENVIATRYKSRNWKHRKSNKDISDILTKWGFSGFDTDKLTIPEGDYDKEKVKSSIGEMADLVKEEFSKLESQEGYNLIIKSLATRALYSIELEKRKANGKDIEGRIFSQEDRDAELVKSIKKRYEMIHKLYEEYEKETLGELNMKSHARGLAKTNHMYHKANELHDEEFRLRYNRVSNRRRYDQVTDIFCYARKFLKDLSTEELEEKVKVENGSLYEAYKERVFDNLVIACKARTALNHSWYIPKLSKKIRNYKIYQFLKNRLEKMKDKDQKMYEGLKEQLETKLAYTDLSKSIFAKKMDIELARNSI